jgi:hypothetical protein
MKLRNMVFVGLGLLVLCGLGGASFYFYTRYQHAQALLKDPTAAAREEIKGLTDKVGKHIILPAEEVPTVATVSDKTKLSGQAFFARSEVGDKVLIYNQAARAILYRPEINKIIEVVTLTTPSVAGTSSASAQLVAARLTIYNSTSTAGLASVAQQKVNKEMPSTLTVTAKQNSNGHYEKSQVVILSPQAMNLGTQLAGVVGAQITQEMPGNEIKPDSDLLLIIGEDFK